MNACQLMRKMEEKAGWCYPRSPGDFMRRKRDQFSRFARRAIRLPNEVLIKKSSHPSISHAWSANLTKGPEAALAGKLPVIHNQMSLMARMKWSARTSV